MTLGDCIREYREEHDMSQRQFADKSGISNAYISMLEKNINPKTGEPPAASYDVYAKVAAMLRISVHELMEKADESEVFLGSGAKMSIEPMVLPIHPEVLAMLDQRVNELENERRQQLLSLFDAMTDDSKEKLLDYAQYIMETQNRRLRHD